MHAFWNEETTKWEIGILTMKYHLQMTKSIFEIRQYYPGDKIESKWEKISKIRKYDLNEKIWSEWENLVQIRKNVAFEEIRSNKIKK